MVSPFPSSVAIFQHLQRMEFTFHNSCVIIDIAPSAVIFLTEFSCWPKGYSNKAILLIDRSHHYTFNDRHHNQVDRCEVPMYQMTMGLILFKYIFSFLYHCQGYFWTWLYIWATRSNCLPFANTWVHPYLLLVGSYCSSLYIFVLSYHLRYDYRIVTSVTMTAEKDDIFIFTSSCL